MWRFVNFINSMTAARLLPGRRNIITSVQCFLLLHSIPITGGKMYALSPPNLIESPRPL